MMGEHFLGIFVMVVLLVLYFVPTILAVNRDHPNMATICGLNILTGWTLIGWVVTLVWSLTNTITKSTLPLD